MDKLRLKFTKCGRAVYISHLDLMHTMQRAFSRAGYRLKYSEGFNPHPQISIAIPLSVGTESLCEILDFRLAEETALDEIPARLSAALPEGIEVKEAYEAQSKAADIKWLELCGRFEYDTISLPEAKKALDAFFCRESIIISKKSKKGISDADILPGIKSITFSEEEDCVGVHAVLSAQNPTLNPDLLAEALRQLSPDIAPDFAEFRRLQIFDENMEVFR